MGIILDLIIVAIIAVTVIISAKQGFVKTVIEVVGFVLAIYLSFTFSTPVANFVYDKAVGPTVMAAIEQGVEDTTADATKSVYEKLPKFIKNNLEFFGVSDEELTSHVNSSLGGGAASVAETVSEKVVEPIVVSVVKTLVSVLIFVVLLFVVRILAKMLNKLFSFSLVGTLNRVLGGVLGVVKGVIFAAVFCAAIIFVGALAGGKILEAVDSSYICGFLNTLLGVNFLGI